MKSVTRLLVVLIGCPGMGLAQSAETWRTAEITFESDRAYNNPLDDAELSVAFTSPSGKVLVAPGFWDGGRTWRVRFAPTEEGIWNYLSTCTNASDQGLDGKRGTLGVNLYRGPLEIYRRGFVKTVPGVRYFQYGDGTPFFYLGDTHWSMPQEPFDKMFTVIVDRRVAQGFTVYQSEPLGAKYNFADGFSEADLRACGISTGDFSTSPMRVWSVPTLSCSFRLTSAGRFIPMPI